MKRWARLATIALLLAAGPARADIPSPEADINRLFADYSRAVFRFNRLVYRNLDSLTRQPDLPGGAAIAAVGAGTARMVSNLTNEPITLVASLLVGDTGTAGLAAKRFAINSTVGLLGFYDPASAWGLSPRYADFGLSLCRMGVGEGGYVVLPFIGPRTIRDGLSDVVLTNLLIWPVVGLVTGGGVSLQTIAIAESIEVGADIVGTRQIDPLARQIRLDDYDTARAAYLAERRARCRVAPTAAPSAETRP